MNRNKPRAGRRSAWLPCLALILVALAGGCATENSNVVAPKPPAYVEAVQKRAAQELERLNQPCPRQRVTDGCSAVHRLVVDYGTLREKLRAARPAD